MPKVLLRCLFTILLLAEFCRAVPPQLQLRVKVTDPSGSLIAGANLELIAAGKRFTTVSDGNGLAEFDIAAAEVKARLSVTARGFAPAEVSISLPRHSDLTVVLHPMAESQTVSVLARGSGVQVNELAESVQIISSRRLQTASDFALDDVLRQAPGFALFRRSSSLTANPTSQGVSLRGIGASGASRALVLEDGVPLNDPFGGWVYWNIVPRAEIDRVELLEGGVSNLYGSNALSGAIDVVRKRPDVGVLSLEASQGSYSTPEGSAFAAITPGAWSFALAAGGHSSNGYILTAPADRGIVDVPATSTDRSIELTLGRRIGEGSLEASAGYFNEDRQNGTPLQTNDTALASGSLRWKQPIGGTRISAALFGQGQSYNQTFSSIASARDSESLTRLQHVPAQRLGGSLEWLNGPEGSPWAIGADFTTVRGVSLETGINGGAATSLSSSGGAQDLFGIFAQKSVAWKRLILTGGLRVDEWANRDASVVTEVLSTGKVTATPLPKRTESFVSPHASALLRLTDSLALTASVGRAFRAPTLNELYRSFRLGNVITNANADLRAEGLLGGEGGILFTRSRMDLRATGFLYRVDDPVANVTLSATPALITRQRRNLGAIESRGVETDLRLRLNQHWDVHAGYQFADSTVVSFSADSTLVGLDVPQVARHSFTLQNEFTLQHWTTAIQARANSNQFDDDRNQFALGRLFTLDAYFARDLGPHLRLFLAGQNLTNDRFLIARTPVRQTGPGAGFRAGIQLQFPAGPSESGR